MRPKPWVRHRFTVCPEPPYGILRHAFHGRAVDPKIVEHLQAEMDKVVTDIRTALTKKNFSTTDRCQSREGSEQCRLPSIHLLRNHPEPCRFIGESTTLLESLEPKLVPFESSGFHLQHPHGHECEGCPKCKPGTCAHVLKYDPRADALVCEMADCDLRVSGESLAAMGFNHRRKFRRYDHDENALADVLQTKDDEAKELLAENAMLRRKLERKR